MTRGPWMFGREIDLAVFVLPSLIGVAFVLGAPARASAIPDWAWITLVLGVDVAHVWSTAFRTYFDPAELAKRPLLYALTPVLCLVVSVLLYARSPALFWRVLAYAAVFHFVRQQIGWAAVYRARAGTTRAIDRLVDDVAIYASTCVPLFLWHVRMPRPFAWMIDGDFVDLAPLRGLAPFAIAFFVLALALFAIHHAREAIRGAVVPLGKTLLVVATALAWWVGIVVAEDDLGFTACNVLPHGIPYFVLLFFYGRARAKSAPDAFGSRVVACGAGAFYATCLVLAALEELGWDRFVFHDRPHVFGAGVDLPPGVLAFVVPLLALPQATHYVLDAFLWRRGAGGREQAVALGFVGDHDAAPVELARGAVAW